MEYYWVSRKSIWPLDMSTSSILYDITIYGAHTCLSGPYKYSLRFSESGRILKQSIRQIKFTWSVNYVSEIFQSSISDTIGTRARRINRAAASCCPVALTYGAAILRLENEARHANFEKALFQSVTKYVQHPLKPLLNLRRCEILTSPQRMRKRYSRSSCSDGNRSFG